MITPAAPWRGRYRKGVSSSQFFLANLYSERLAGTAGDSMENASSRRSPAPTERRAPAPTEDGCADVSPVAMSPVAMSPVATAAR